MVSSHERGFKSEGHCSHCSKGSAASQPKTDETVLCRQAAVMDWVYHDDERCLKSNFFAASLCTRPSCLPLCHVLFVVLRCHSMLSKQCHFSQCCRLWWVNLFKLLNYYCLLGKFINLVFIQIWVKMQNHNWTKCRISKYRLLNHHHHKRLDLDVRNWRMCYFFSVSQLD